MAERSRSSQRPERPRSEAGGARPAPRARDASSAEELLEIADELEAYARELVGVTRRLQRLARAGGGGESGGGASRPRPLTRGSRPPGAGRANASDRKGASRGGEEQERKQGRGTRGSPDREEGGSRPPKRGGKPSWAPESRKRRS